MAKIKNITKYLIELQTLDISNNLEQYHQKTGVYRTKINTLQQKALIELLMLPPAQLAKQHLNLKKFSGKLKRFFDWYLSKCDEFDKGKLQETEFWFFLHDYFIIKGEHKGSISLRLLHNLHDAFMFKDGSLEAILKQIETKPNTRKPTFKTTLSNIQLRTLFDELIHKQLLHHKTDYRVFEAVFSGVDVSAVKTKIKWHGANNLLAYFIDKIYTNNLIEKPVNHWDTAKHCFINANNLRQAKDRYENSKTGHPKQADVIDNILKKVYTGLQ